MTTVAEAQAALDAWDAAHQVAPTDPGLQSMRFHESQTKRTKNLNAYLNRLGREARERERLEEALSQAKRAEYRASLPTEPVNPAELKGASAVLVLRPHGTEWHRVIRVNAKTVTCDGGGHGMDDPRFPHDRIVGVRHPEPTP